MPLSPLRRLGATLLALCTIVTAGGTTSGSMPATSAGWTAEASTTANTVSTASLALVSPEVDTVDHGSVQLTWPSAEVADASYVLTRIDPGGERQEVYRGAERSVIDDGDTPASLQQVSVSAMSAGGSHSCAIGGERAFCWGANDSGQVGDGTTTDRSRPVPVRGLPGPVTDISAGPNSTCAIAAGAAYCWGSNESGQLGNGTTTSSSIPQSVAGLDSGVTDIDSGLNHACAVVNGAARCWGSDAFWQLGNGPAGGSATPVTATGLSSGVTRIAAGDLHTCAIASGQAWCWGFGLYGQMGDGTYRGSLSPTVVSDLPATVTDLDAGGNHVCAVAAQKAFCWGTDTAGQSVSSVPDRNLPTEVPLGFSAVAKISVGRTSACAVSADRPIPDVRCWGVNAGLGITSTGMSGISSFSPVTFISVGSQHACTVGGPSTCLGANDRGQLGHSNVFGAFSEPVRLLAPTCAAGQQLREEDLTCSLTAGATYDYELSYGIARWTSPVGTVEATTGAPMP